MMTKNREKPGAQTPWLFVNQLLTADERFEVCYAEWKGFLLAPKTTSSLAALLYLLHQHHIPFYVQGQKIKKNPSPACFVSARAFSHFLVHEGDVIEIGAGCSLMDLQPILFEKQLEVNVEESPLASPKQSVVDLILIGQTAGLQLKQENVVESLLGVEWITEKGCQLQWGGSQRSCLAGPALHKLIWGMQHLPGVIVKIYLKAYRLPTVRLQLVWSFRYLDALWNQFDQLKRFSSSWERLDCVWSGKSKEQSFILAQISGLKEEMEAFTQICPDYHLSQPEDRRLQLKQFLNQQTLFAYPASKQQQLQPDEYLWYHGLEERAWQLTPRILEKEEEQVEPIWKQYLWESVKNG